MKICILQTDIQWKNPLNNIKDVSQLIEKHPYADMYILPEMWATGFCLNPPLSAPEAFTAMQQWSVQYHCVVVGSLYINGYNQLLFIDNGKCLSYSKRHLFSYAGEDLYISPGKKRIIVESNGIRFLLQICYDLRFPVFSRNQMDYDAIIYTANWPVTRQKAWNTLLMARAIENQVYVIGVNRVGSDLCNKYNGESQVISPQGECILNCEHNVSAFTTDISLEEVKKCRQQYPFYRDADTFTLNIES